MSVLTLEIENNDGSFSVIPFEKDNAFQVITFLIGFVSKRIGEYIDEVPEGSNLRLPLIRVANYTSSEWEMLNKMANTKIECGCENASCTNKTVH